MDNLTLRFIFSLISFSILIFTLRKTLKIIKANKKEKALNATVAYIKIWNGKGKGQIRRLANFTEDGLLTVYPAWDVAPDSDSAYIILPSEVYEQHVSNSLEIEKLRSYYNRGKPKIPNWLTGSGPIPPPPPPLSNEGIVQVPKGSVADNPFAEDNEAS